MSGSPNAPDELVNALLRHRIQASGVERPVQRHWAPLTEEQVAEYAACVCSGRPEVKTYTFFARYNCECRRSWEYHPGTDWVRVA